MRLIILYKTIQVVLMATAFVLLLIPDRWCPPVLQHSPPAADEKAIMEAVIAHPSEKKTTAKQGEAVVFWWWKVEHHQEEPKASNETKLTVEADSHTEADHLQESTKDKVEERFPDETNTSAAEVMAELLDNDVMTAWNDSDGEFTDDETTVPHPMNAFLAWLQHSDFQFNKTIAATNETQANKTLRKRRSVSGGRQCVCVEPGWLTDDFAVWRHIFAGWRPSCGCVRFPELISGMVFALTAVGVGVSHMLVRHDRAIFPWELVLSVCLLGSAIGCGSSAAALYDVLAPPAPTDGGEMGLHHRPSQWLAAALMAYIVMLMGLIEIVFIETLAGRKLFVNNQHNDLTPTHKTATQNQNGTRLDQSRLSRPRGRRQADPSRMVQGDGTVGRKNLPIEYNA